MLPPRGPHGQQALHEATARRAYHDPQPATLARLHPPRCSDMHHRLLRQPGNQLITDGFQRIAHPRTTDCPAAQADAHADHLCQQVADFAVAEAIAPVSSPMSAVRHGPDALRGTATGRVARPTCRQWGQRTAWFAPWSARGRRRLRIPVVLGYVGQ